MTQLATHGAAPKSIGRKVEKSVRSALQNRSVELLEAETFFCLAL